MHTRVLHSAVVTLALVCIHAAPTASPTLELRDSDTPAQLEMGGWNAGRVVARGAASDVQLIGLEARKKVLEAEAQDINRARLEAEVNHAEETDRALAAQLQRVDVEIQAVDAQIDAIKKQ